jgi:hypothetical protein
MTSNQYQAAYLQGIEMLRARGKLVGDPYTATDGTRQVLVDGFPCGDDLVLEEAWGKDISDHIQVD